MNRLIRANFTRLFGSAIFRVGMAISILLGALMILVRFQDMKMNPEMYSDLSAEAIVPDNLIFMGGIYLMFAVAVVTSYFIGTEYSDGTIRNKIMVGHSRAAIYLANFIVVCTASALIHLAYILTTLILGSTLIMPPALPAGTFLLFTLTGLLAMTAFTALCLLFSMLLQSRSTGSVCALLIAVLFLFASAMIQSRLTEPEYFEGYTYTNEEGESVVQEREKNPHYLTGSWREFYELLYDAVPSCQFLQILELKDDQSGNMAGYSLGLLILSTGAGIVAFRKKDLR